MDKLLGVCERGEANFTSQEELSYCQFGFEERVSWLKDPTKISVQGIFRLRGEGLAIDHVDLSSNYNSILN